MNYLVWASVLFVMNLLDVGFTRLLVEKGITYEANPVVANVIHFYGWKGALVLKLSVLIIIFYVDTITKTRWMQYIFWIAFLWYATVTVWHLGLIVAWRLEWTTHFL